MLIEVRGILQPILVRQISTLQFQRFFKKGCKVYVILISELEERKGLSLKDYKVFQEYTDVFLEEVPDLPPKREVNFTIDLVLGEVPISKVPYCMRTPKLIELKMKLQELLDKKYIRPSVSPWGMLDCCSLRRMMEP